MATALVVAVGVVPTKAFGRQTGTLPVIQKPDLKTSLHKVKDSGNLPVIMVPNPNNVNGDGSGGGYGYGGGNSYTITIGLNYATTNAQPLVLLTDRPDLIQIPLIAVVPGGSDSVTATYKVPYTSGKHCQHAHVFASCNGTAVECTIHVHYKGEN